MPRQIVAGGGASGGQTTGQGVGDTKAEAAVAFALSWIGTPYRWGGTQPGKGLDCSGLTEEAYDHAGLYIPRTTFLQYAYPLLRPVSRSNLLPGDLLYYYANDGGRGPGHVVMYTGDGKIVQAAHTGTRVAQSDVFWSGFVGARRRVGSGNGFTGTLPKGARSTTDAQDLSLSVGGVVGGVSAATSFLGRLPQYLEIGGGGAILLGGVALGVYGATGKRPSVPATPAKPSDATPARDPAEKADDVERRAMARSDAAAEKANQAQERRAGADARKESAADKATVSRAKKRNREKRTATAEEERDFRGQAAYARGKERREVAAEKRGDPLPKGQMRGLGAARRKPGSRVPVRR